MSSEAKAPIQQQTDPVPNLDSYRTRDDFVRAYKPATDEELFLATQIARAWGHLQDVYQLRVQVIAGKGLVALFNDNFEKYKMLMRHVAEAERMWRYAVQEFQRARRRRTANVRTSTSTRAPAANHNQTVTPSPSTMAHASDVAPEPPGGHPALHKQPLSGEKMSNEHKIPFEQLPDPAMELDFYQTREELMNAYNPTTDRQRELINYLADSYEQLRESHRIRKLIEQKGVRGLTAQEFEDYKALIHRGVEGDLMQLREFAAPPGPPAPTRDDRQINPCAHRPMRKTRS